MILISLQWECTGQKFRTALPGHTHRPCNCIMSATKTKFMDIDQESGISTLKMWHNSEPPLHSYKMRWTGGVSAPQQFMTFHRQDRHDSLRLLVPAPPGRLAGWAGFRSRLPTTALAACQQRACLRPGLHLGHGSGCDVGKARALHCNRRFRFRRGVTGSSPKLE